MPGKAFTSASEAMLYGLQRDALRYFLDNQLASGLVLDRQANWGPRRDGGLCSMAATGMGLIALALASQPPYRLLTPHEASRRVCLALRTALDRLPSTSGILPHFVKADTLAAIGIDRRSTIDTGWLVVGALWAAACLDDPLLEMLANRLLARIDWRCWLDEDGLILHGQGTRGRPLSGRWDRFNAETAFLYVLAAGVCPAVRLPPVRLATVAGLTFPDADLGLFVSQYSVELLDVDAWSAPSGPRLSEVARLAALANVLSCRAQADRFRTYRHFWGLSAGDGPGEGKAREGYRAYAPAGPVDGTAHLTATLASIAHAPAHVWENLHRISAVRRSLRGRYGLSNVNLDCDWISPDVVGIDLGAAILALDNVFHSGRIRGICQRVGILARGWARLGFTRETGVQMPLSCSA